MDMQTLHEWLSERPKKAQPLADALGISLSYLSQVRHGHRPIQIEWMPAIEKFTLGHLTIVGMVLQGAKSKADARLARQAQQEA